MLKPVRYLLYGVVWSFLNTCEYLLSLLIVEDSVMDTSKLAFDTAQADETNHTGARDGRKPRIQPSARDKRG